MFQIFKWLLFFYGLFFLSVTPSWGLCVSEGLVNLRKGPGSRYPIAWTVGKYTPLVQVGRRGEWRRVEDMEGERYWVHRRLVRSGYNCLSIQGKVVNLRSGPGAGFPKAHYERAEKYSSFHVIKRKAAWFHVQDAFGYDFWVHENYVWRPMQVTEVSF